MFTVENGITILKALFNNMFQELDYENADEFYSYLNYELELSNELQLMDIQGANDLLEALKRESEES